MRNGGHVEHANELPHAAGIQLRHGREIQHDSPETAAQDDLHRRSQFEVEGDVQGSGKMKYRDAGRTFL